MPLGKVISLQRKLPFLTEMKCNLYYWSIKVRWNASHVRKMVHIIAANDTKWDIKIERNWTTTMIDQPTNQPFNIYIWPSFCIGTCWARAFMFMVQFQRYTDMTFMFKDLSSHSFGMDVNKANTSWIFIHLTISLRCSDNSSNIYNIIWCRQWIESIQLLHKNKIHD